MEIDDRRMISYIVLYIGCMMVMLGTVLSNSFTRVGIVLITLSALAIRVQEEKVFRHNLFKEWSGMKTEAAGVYFQCGVSMIMAAIVLTNTVITVVAVSGLYLTVVATGKTFKKELLIRASCESIYKTAKFFRITPELDSGSKILKLLPRFFGITSERCSEIMKFKGCLRVAA